jgi:hypothetical protein
MEAPPDPLSSRLERTRISYFAPLATTACTVFFLAAAPYGSAALPFVISTEAYPDFLLRAADNDGVYGFLFSSRSLWKRRPTLCHLDRSAAQWRDLRFQRSSPDNVF